MFNWFKRKATEPVPPPHSTWARITYTPKFYCVNACVGYRSTKIYYDAGEIFLDPECGHQALGDAVNTAFNKSKFLHPSEIAEYFSNDNRYEEYWIPKLLEKREVKSVTTLYRTMKRVSVKKSEGVITITPSRREGRAFAGISENSTIQIPADSSSLDIGAAVYKAFNLFKTE